MQGLELAGGLAVAVKLLNDYEPREDRDGWESHTIRDLVEYCQILAANSRQSSTARVHSQSVLGVLEGIIDELEAERNLPR